MTTTIEVAAARDARPAPSGAGRWWLLVAAVLVQLALGGVYAWSVFNKPLMLEFGWTKAEAVLPFETAIGVIFIGSLLGGRVQDRLGPRPVALVGGALYALGVAGASLVHRPDQLWLLVLTYGVLGGLGLGTVYITPIAMLGKWFPDRRGLVTGIAVGGFGFGAVLTAPVATTLLAHTERATSVFLPLGGAFLVAALGGAAFFRNPPADVAVPLAPAATAPATDGAPQGLTLAQALRTPQWYLLTGTLTLNTLAGIALVSQASDAAQELGGLTVAGAASFVGVMGLFNGAGRIAWAAVSDRIGRRGAFVGILAVHAVAFALLPHVTTFWAFAVLGALIYLAYGGAFGTMPATAADVFGTRHAGAVYGAMIVAWSLGGVAGPQLATALYLRSGGYTLPFTVIAIIAAVAVALPLAVRPLVRPVVGR